MRSSRHPTLRNCLRPRRCAFISALIWYLCSPGSFRQGRLLTNRYRFRRKRQSTPAGSLLSVAPPVDGLDVVRMIVPPHPSHASRTDVVGNDVVIIRKLDLAERTSTVL